MTSKRMMVIRGARVLDAPAHSADKRDILVNNGLIVEVGPPDMAAPPDAEIVRAADQLLMPGLINAHSHGHGSLSKGLGDRWSLELLLNAGPWLNAERTFRFYSAARSANNADRVCCATAGSY
jgi:5-methylthioadenosine/S-adenosylhomocysteine deaminase